MAWRWLGNIFQPIMGTGNYLLGPLKPSPKPVALPTGALRPLAAVQAMFATSCHRRAPS